MRWQQQQRLRFPLSFQQEKQASLRYWTRWALAIEARSGVLVADGPDIAVSSASAVAVAPASPFPILTTSTLPLPFPVGAVTEDNVA